MILWTSCRRISTCETVFFKKYSQTEKAQNHKVAVYLSVDILQHDVLGFKVSVYDLVLVQILDTRSWSRKQWVLLNDEAPRDTSEWTSCTQNKHWTYQHHWVTKALHSLSNRSSFQVYSASGTHTNTVLSHLQWIYIIWQSDDPAWYAATWHTGTP